MAVRLADLELSFLDNQELSLQTLARRLHPRRAALRLAGLPDVASVKYASVAHAIVLSCGARLGIPLKKGRCGTLTHDYKRNGTTTMFAALNTLALMPKHRHWAMQEECSAGACIFHRATTWPGGLRDDNP